MNAILFSALTAAYAGVAAKAIEQASAEPAQEQPAFTVLVDGHEYSVYKSGKITGFEGKQVLVFNRIPLLCQQEAFDYWVNWR